MKPSGIVAEAIILIGGKFDLSLESTVGFAPMVAAWLIVKDTGEGGSGLGITNAGLGIRVNEPASARLGGMRLCVLVGLVPAIHAVEAGSSGPGCGSGEANLSDRTGGSAWMTGTRPVTTRWCQPEFVVLITNGRTLFDLPSSFTYIGSAQWLGVPASILLSLVIARLGSEEARR